MKIYSLIIFLFLIILLITPLSTVYAEEESYYIHSVTYLSFKTADGYPIATVLFDTTYKIDFNGTYEDLTVVKTYETLYSNTQYISEPVYIIKNNELEGKQIHVYIPYVLNITLENYTVNYMLGGGFGVGFETMPYTLSTGHTEVYKDNESFIGSSVSEPGLYAEWYIQNISIVYVDGYVENISYPVNLVFANITSQDLNGNRNLTFYNIQNIIVSYTPDTLQNPLIANIDFLSNSINNTYSEYILLKQEYSTVSNEYNQLKIQYNRLSSEYNSLKEKHSQNINYTSPSQTSNAILYVLTGIVLLIGLLIGFVIGRH